MSKDLLASIRQQNEQNHRADGALAGRSTTPTSYHALLDKIQDRLQGEIHSRVERAIERFDQRAASLRSSGEAGTEDVQAAIAEFTGAVSDLGARVESLTTGSEREGERGDAREVSTLLDRLGAFETRVLERLDRLPGLSDERVRDLEAALDRLTQVAPELVEHLTTTDDDAPSTNDEGLEELLRPLHSKLERIEALVCDSPMHLEAVTEDLSLPLLGLRKDEFTKLIDERLQGVVAQIVESNSESPDWSSLEERLLERFGAGDSTESESAVLARLEALDESLSARLNQVVAEASTGQDSDRLATILHEAVADALGDGTPVEAGGAQDSILMARLEGLEDGLRSAMEAFHAKTTQTLVDRCLELEHAIPKAVSDNGGLAAVEQSETGELASSPKELVDVVRSLVEGNALPTDVLELPDMVMNLRKDFSLLVHTINSHLEETRNLSNHVTRCVIDAVRELDAERKSNAPEREIPALDEALRAVESLRDLPDLVASQIRQSMPGLAADAAAPPNDDPTEVEEPQADVEPSA